MEDYMVEQLYKDRPDQLAAIKEHLAGRKEPRASEKETSWLVAEIDRLYGEVKQLKQGR